MSTLNNNKVRKLTYNSELINKKRKLDDEDRIDPIEKLLSLNNDYEDINNYLQDQEITVKKEEEDSDDYDSEEDEDEEYERKNSKHEVSLNFTKIFNDNLVRMQQSNNFINNFSSFGMLGNSNFDFSYPAPSSQQQQSSSSNTQSTVQNQTPFFKLVNFNPKPKSANVFDELINFDDEVDPKDPLPVSDSEEEEAKTPINTSPLLNNSKMCFTYRQYDNLNLSNLKPQESTLKILNENSILSGKLNETIGSGKFMINDFFL